MHLDTGAIQRDGFDFDTDDLLLLQLLESAIKYTTFCPAIHAGIDSVPVAKAFGQTAPLAAMLCNIENGVENLQVGKADIAALTRHAVLDFMILGFCDFHHRIISNSVNRS